jgi:hypothetical protein
MDPTVIVIIPIVVGVAALVVLAVVAARRSTAKRRAALEAVAQQCGWSFAAGKTEPGALGVGPLPLMSRGRAQRASNVIRLSGAASGVAVFDYQYTVGAGKHQRTIVQTVAHVRSTRLALPPFTLSAENLFHKVGGAVGYHDIDFDSSPEFSRKYLLRSKQAEDRVRDLFTPSVRAYFEQRTPVIVEGHEQELLVYKSGRRVKPEDLPAFVDDAQAIARELER